MEAEPLKVTFPVDYVLRTTADHTTHPYLPFCLFSLKSLVLGNNRHPRGKD